MIRCPTASPSEISARAGVVTPAAGSAEDRTRAAPRRVHMLAAGYPSNADLRLLTRRPRQASEPLAAKRGKRLGHPRDGWRVGSRQPCGACVLADRLVLDLGVAVEVALAAFAVEHLGAL